MARRTQANRDRQRKTYVLFFPSTLEHEAVVAWLRAIAGTRSKSTLAFELWSTGSGFSYRMKVPWQTAEYVMAQLQTQLPGLRYEHELEPPRRAWTHAVELGMSTPSRPLNIHETTPTAIVGALRGVKPGESIVVQLVVSPAAPSRPPVNHESMSDTPRMSSLWRGNGAGKDEVRDRRDKLAEPNFQAVMRVAAVADSMPRAKYLTGNVRSILRSLNTHANKFERRMARPATLQSRIDHPATPTFFPMLLSAPELAALMAWPAGNVLIPGLPPTMSPVLPAQDTVPQEGMVVGRSNFPGHERPIAIGWEQALMHVWYGGVTGVGKTEALAHIGRQAMQAGHGLIMLQVSGNLYDKLLDYIPVNRLEDVILLDIQDYQKPLGLNLLDQGNPLSVIDQIMDLFIYKYGSLGVWGQEALYHALRTIAATPGLSFTDIAPLLMPRTTEEIAWADSVTRALTDPELKRWWQRMDNRDRREQQQRTDPVMSRIWQLASRPELRAVLGQATSSFQLHEVLRDNKILLINLNGVSGDAASLAGTLIMNSLWHAIQSTPKAKPSYLILDEYASIADLPIDTEAMLAQARKHKVGMVLANQNMGQLKPAMRDAILANARNKVALQLNANDANTVIREFGKHLEADNFTHLQAYEAIAQVQTAKGVSSPMTLRTMAPAARTGLRSEAVARSREKYGRDKDTVLRDIEERHRLDTTPTGPRPVIGGAD